MCGIAGFFNTQQQFTKNITKYQKILHNMKNVLSHRGPDDSGIYIHDCFGFAHVRLSIIDLTTGNQPMTKKIYGEEYSIVYNGEIYNTNEIKNDLIQKGYIFETTSDTEMILYGYLEYGTDIVKKLNGIFAFAIADTKKRQLHLFRDRAGVKPLFYTNKNDTIVFSSELKGLFQYPDIVPIVDNKGLNEIFSIGPAKTYGCGVYKYIDEVLPGYFITFDEYGKHMHCYWKLQSHVHTDSYEKTVEKTSFLVQDAIRRQMVSDVPICTFLSGGVDSSIVSAVCAEELKKQGKQLHTFSFDFVDDDKYFKANAFQPSQDRPYVEKMVKHIDSIHHFLECETTKQADLLTASVDAHDLPCMADVESSMLYFCSVVKQSHKVALTGECADEIFGGYPWFHKKECFDADTFPWTMDLEARKVMLSDDFLYELHMNEYVSETYHNSVAETPRLDEDTPEEARRREISYLNLKWFMQTLLDRMDRTSMYSGLEARVPFADHNIIEYLWNIPWNIKTKHGIVKHILREAARVYLPDEILFRKKSPYPKTYDTKYELLLANRLKDIIHDSTSPILQFLDIQKVNRFLKSPSDYGKPWYGQLMAAPQMIAYMIQVNYWLEKYHVKVML